MPPRKRAASAPKDEPEQEPLAPKGDAGTEPEEGSAAADAADEAPADTDQDDEAERGDVQTVDQPCQECFPNGWPEIDGAFSVGCTHGTYVRSQD